MHSLAAVLEAQGKYAAAEMLLRTALAQKEKALGLKHPDYGASLHNLACILKAQKKYGEAGALLRQVLTLLENTLGAAHHSYSVALHELAGVHEAQGEYGESETLLRQALALKEQALGIAHPSLCPTLSNLAVTFVLQHRPSEAEPLVGRALQIAESTHGARHPDTAQILVIAAQIQAALGKAEARETAGRALELLMSTLGAAHPLTRRAALVLQRIAAGTRSITPKPGLGEDLEAQLHQGMDALKAGDPQHAFELFSRVAAQAGAADLPHLEASACGMLAQVLLLADRRKDGLAHARRALRIAEQLGQQDAAENFRQLLKALESTEEPSAGGSSGSFNARIKSAVEQARGGDIPAAVDALTALANEAQTAGAPGPETSARIALGQLLLVADNRELAVIQLHRALEIAEQLGNQGAVRHVRELLSQSA